jgi:hypothetical protein
VASGWAELWKRIRRLAEVDERDFEGTWARFRKLASSSERASALKILVRVGSVLSERERYSLAVAVTRILAPIEWPSEWIPARTKLTNALDALIEETDPDNQLPASNPYVVDAQARETSHVVLYVAGDLLRKPCRRDELRSVAALCNTGIALRLRLERKRAGPALNLPSGVRQRDIEASSLRFRRAMAAYVEAANELNDAVGAVLFEGLHAPLEQEI